MIAPFRPPDYRALTAEQIKAYNETEKMSPTIQFTKEGLHYTRSLKDYKQVPEVIKNLIAAVFTTIAVTWNEKGAQGLWTLRAFKPEPMSEEP